jgi:hypothetical protein
MLRSSRSHSVQCRAAGRRCADNTTECLQEKETPIEVRSVDNSAVRASQIARINKTKVTNFSS